MLGDSGVLAGQSRRDPQRLVCRATLPLLGPLLRDGGTDLYVAAWSAENDEPVVVSLLDPGNPIEEFSSITALVTVTNACFAAGVYALDSDGLLDITDTARYDTIYEQITGRPPT